MSTNCGPDKWFSADVTSKANSRLNDKINNLTSRKKVLTGTVLQCFITTAVFIDTDLNRCLKYSSALFVLDAYNCNSIDLA